MASSLPGQPPRLAGFDYIRPLGSGGFAHVYLYEQDLPRRSVAVKVIDDGGPPSARERSEFEAEADAMARLSSHPSIVSIHLASVAADGRPFLVMEYCPDSMRDRTRGRPAPIAEVLDAGVRLAGALESAHAAGILHRDIKPSNVLIAATGRPALADFGISSLVGRDPSAGSSRAMSIPWAAPEVIAGRTAGTVASEVWSLGATLYTFAAGRSPFELGDRVQNTQERMGTRIARALYTPVPGAQGYGPLDEVLARAMRRAPEERYASMREFAVDLQQLQRRFGLDVTALDLVGIPPSPRPHTGSAPRAPLPASVRAASRSQRRSSEQLDRDGLLVGRPASPLRAGLVGAGIAIAVLAAIAGALALGGAL